MSLFNTKVIVLFKIKDYPIGKNLKCYVWFEGDTKDMNIEEKLKSSLVLSESYKNYDIKEIQVVSKVMTNSMPQTDKFGELNLMSISNVFEGNPKKEKNRKVNTTTDLSLLTQKELEDLDRKVNKELFKRNNNLNENEYVFYMNNMNDIKLTEVKEIYEKCGGDIYKLRKERIRENISNMLENKKVV
jgi:hypothetical protein